MHIFRIAGFAETGQICGRLGPSVIRIISHHLIGGVFQRSPHLIENALQLVFLLPEAVLERCFRNGLWCTLRISFHCVVESLSVERHFQHWEQLKVKGGYAKSV